MKEQQEYIVRVQGSRAWTYGLGEVVSPNVAFFKAGNYDLTPEELTAKLKAIGKAVLRAN